jgi:NIPSNAP protein
MINRKWSFAVIAAGMLAAGFALRGEMQTSPAHAQAANRVFELRIYTAQPGKFEAMKARFRDHVVPMFEKHGMTVIGFWTASDAPKSENTLTYVLAFPSREAAKKSWDAFRSDPERAKVWAETEKDGPINLKVESMYLDPVAYSRIK